MKIIIYQNREVNKEESKIGNDSENKVETLEFEFPEEYQDFTKYIEFQIKGEKYTDIIENDKYEITRAIAKQGKIKTQIVLRKSIENDVLVFKSNVFELNVSKSINATENIPDEYPTWIDNLTTLKQNLEKSEEERVTSENKRIEAELQREETFSQMEESVENAVKEIADKKADYNQNALEKTNEYNELAEQKTNAFNSNTETKTNNFNQNATEKTTAFNTDVSTKTNEFDTNATNKTTEFNNNVKSKTDAFNSNSETKINTYNSNVETKTNEYNANANNKINEYNLNAQEKMNEYNANAEELTNRITTLESENEELQLECKRLKEDNQAIAIIGQETGENITLNDSSDARFKKFEIGGNHKQETREGYNVLADWLTAGVYKENEDIEINTPGKMNSASYIEYEANMTLFKGYSNNQLSTGGQKVPENWKGKNIVISYTDAFYYEDTERKTTKINWLIFWDENLNQLVSYDKPPSIVQVPENAELMSFTLFCNGNREQLLYIEDLMITLSDTKKVYEQYGASPSSEFPSEVKTVGEEYQILEYIESRGTQYINTGYKANNKTKISISFFPNEKDMGFLFGARVDANDVNQFVLFYRTDGYQYSFRFADNPSINIRETVNLKTFAEFSAAKYLINNGAITEQNIEYSGTFTGTLPLYLFGTNGNNNNNFGSSTKLYNCKIYDNDILVRDFIPCYRKSDNEIGLYDTVNNVFHTNQGTGEFIKGPETGIVIKNIEIKVDNGLETTDINYKSQTKVLPIQQEMLEGDYIDDKEYHEWEKYTFTGEEAVVKGGTKNNNQFIISQLITNVNYDTLGNYNDDIASQIKSNYFTSIGTTSNNNGKIGLTLCRYSPNTQIRFGMGLNSDITTVEKFKSWLAQQYANGTPVTIHYKLATPIALELTEEQKKVKKEIDDTLHTYKNTTHIFSTNELSPIFNVEYLKDTQAYIDNQINKLTTAVVELGGNINV